MTIKELIETLQACNEDAEVYIADDCGVTKLKDDDIYADADSNCVMFDISVASLATKGVQN